MSNQNPTNPPTNPPPTNPPINPSVNRPTSLPVTPPSSTPSSAAPAVPAAAQKNPVLSMAIKDKAVLYAAYMQFLNSGGLFIPTPRPFQWGEEVTLSLTLMEETERFIVQAKVVWLTPVGAQGNRAPGIGVQFKGDEGNRLRNKIETYLAGALSSDRPTNTL